jgi:hypothetical protein
VVNGFLLVRGKGRGKFDEKRRKRAFTAAVRAVRGVPPRYISGEEHHRKEKVGNADFTVIL